jgi:hypothetical protein
MKQPSRHHTVPSRVRRGDEKGNALVIVIMSMFVLTLLVVAALGYAVANVPQSRRAQDYRAAFSAAQAGIDDFLQNLNVCDTYWDAPCPNSPASDARKGGNNWNTVPGTTGSNAATYSQEVIGDPLTNGGVIRLKVRGMVNGVMRTLVYELRKTSFLNFIYYTDFETTDPARLVSLYPAKTVPGNNSSEGDLTYQSGYSYDVAATTLTAAKACEKYYYGGRTTWATSVKRTDTYSSGKGNVVNLTMQRSCPPIQFSSRDNIRGPLHTNDALYLSGTPLFAQKTESSWPSTGDPKPGTKLWWGPGSPSTAGKTPMYADPLRMPPNNASIRAAALAEGCVYTGPTEIIFQSNGQLKVTSPGTKSVVAGCSTGNMTSAQTVSGPRNGVIYVDGLSTTCSGDALPTWQNISGDVTPYSCTSGDVFTKGTVAGKYTIAAANDIDIVGDLTYQGGKTGRDVLGLVANNNVQILHPVNSSGGSLTVPGAPSSPGLKNITVHAALLSVQHSFTVQNYQYGGDLGSLNIFGAISQKFRGPVGTSSGTTVASGYGKEYVYDTRLTTLSPPSFLDPVEARWEVVKVSEESGK